MGWGEVSLTSGDWARSFEEGEEMFNAFVFWGVGRCVMWLGDLGALLDMSPSGKNCLCGWRGGGGVCVCFGGGVGGCGICGGEGGKEALSPALIPSKVLDLDGAGVSLLLLSCA